MNLKSTLLAVIDLVSNTAGPAAKAVLVLARWAVTWFVPDNASVGDSTLMNAAPETAKEIVEKIFDLAASYVSSDFLKSTLTTAKNLILNYALDYVWDNIFSPTPVANVIPGEVKITDDHVAEICK